MMPASSPIAFAPQVGCLDAATLVAYQAGTLPFSASQQSREHLCVCDFCGAALQLVAKQSVEEDGWRATEAPRIPLAMLLFAQQSLSPTFEVESASAHGQLAVEGSQRPASSQPFSLRSFVRMEADAGKRPWLQQQHA